MNISYDEARKLIDNGAIIVDVKTYNEYLLDHIKGAINIPINNIVDILKIVKDKDKKVILVCSNGKRSYKAYKYLLNLGYKSVYVLDKK